MNYLVVWRTFIMERLPILLRSFFLGDLLEVLAGGAIYTYIQFIETKAEASIKAGLTSSRKALEAYLRDRYDEGINIFDSGTNQRTLLFREAHSRFRPALFTEQADQFSPLLYREANEPELGYSFIVELPTASASYESQIRGEVQKIKPVNTNFNIELI